MRTVDDNDALELELLGLTPCAHICEYGLNPVLVDQAQGCARHPQADPAVFGFDPEPAVLQVGEEPSLGPVVCMGNIVSDHRAFARYFAYACHLDTPSIRAAPPYVRCGSVNSFRRTSPRVVAVFLATGSGDV